MNVREWRSRADLRAAANELLNHPTFKAMLAVAEETSPAWSPRKLQDDTDCIFELGKIYGYNGALSLLRTMADPLPVPNPQVPVSFNAEQ